MADEAEVEVAEEGVVEVALEGGVAPPKQEAEAKPEPKPAPQPRVRIKEPEPPAPDVAATKALQEAVDNEKRLRQAAEQTAATERQRADQEAARRQTREQELEQARQNIETRELSAIEAGIASATQQIAGAQRELSAALAEGNFEKTAEVQTRLSKATAALDRWEDKKATYESGQQTRTAVAEGGAVEQQPVVTTVSQFERYIGGMQPAAQSWLRAHPECAPSSVGGKEEMNSKMMRGHYDALAQGFAPNSDKYFQVIEESTGYRKPAVVEAASAGEEGGETPPPAKPSKQKQLSAPPSREPPGSSSTGTTRTVRLTKEEQEAARFSFPNMEPAKAFAEYAKNKVALDAEGKLGRTSH